MYNKLDQMDQIKPNWAEVNQGGPNGPKWTDLTEGTEVDQMDQIIRWIGPNGLNRPKWTEQDRIDLIGPK